MDGTLKKALAIVLVASIFLVGFVAGQQIRQSNIQYSIVADVYVELLTPLNLGTLASPSTGSKTFLDAVTVQASKSGYAYLAFSLDGDLETVVNQFDSLVVNIRNNGGIIVTLDLNHLTETYTLPIPQTTSYNVEVLWGTKEAVTATGTIILTLDVT